MIDPADYTKPVRDLLRKREYAAVYVWRPRRSGSPYGDEPGRADANAASPLRIEHALKNRTSRPECMHFGQVFSFGALSGIGSASHFDD